MVEITTWVKKLTSGIDLAKALAKLSSCLQDLWWLILLIVALVVYLSCSSSSISHIFLYKSSASHWLILVIFSITS